MFFLLPSYAAVALYSGLYALHCFQKRHWLAAITVSVLTLLPLVCAAALLFLR